LGAASGELGCGQLAGGSALGVGGGVPQAASGDLGFYDEDVVVEELFSAAPVRNLVSMDAREGRGHPRDGTATRDHPPGELPLIPPEANGGDPEPNFFDEDVGVRQFLSAGPLL